MIQRHNGRPPLAGALLAVAFALSAAYASAAPQSTGAASDMGLTARLDALFAAAYPADEPGAAVLVQRGDEVLLRRGYGMADLEMGVAIEPEMVFRLGSITKQITAAAIVRLAREGKLALSDPIGRHLPGYPEPQAAVTVEQLLHHTGGIPEHTDDDAFWQSSRRDQTADEMIATWKDLPLDFPPGSRWSYSNSGYYLLGVILEKASGMSYADYVENELLAPLGLDRTGYEDSSEILPGRVRGYAGAAADGYRNAEYLSMTLPYSAGSLYSTVDDLGRWARALAAGEVVPPADRDRMWTPARLPDGLSTGYGLGLSVLDYQGHRIVHHGGGINGFATFLVMAPEADVVVAVLSNNPAGGASPQQLATRAITIALGTPLEERPSVDLPAETLAEYVGVYTIDGGSEDIRTFTVAEGRLWSQRSAGAKLPVSFSAEDAFYYADSLTTGRFLRDETGTVTGTRMVQALGNEEGATKTDREPEERRSITVDPALLDTLVGRYEIAPGFFLAIRREADELVGQATGQPPFRLLAETPTRWFVVEVDAVIEFVGSEDGRADSLVLHQGGREMPGPRVD